MEKRNERPAVDVFDTSTLIPLSEYEEYEASLNREDEDIAWEQQFEYLLDNFSEDSESIVSENHRPGQA